MKHIEGSFRGYRDYNLYYQSWLPSGIPRAILLIVHGLHEHSGRYTNLVDYFISEGYAIYSFDLRGHGRSEGLPGYVERFWYYLYDLKAFFDLVRSEYSDTRIFLLGHSMGGTIVVTYAIDHQNEFVGLLVSGALLEPGSNITKALMVIARILSVLAPRMGTTEIDTTTISHDQAVVDAYVNDPLVYQGKIRARQGAELIKMYQKLPYDIEKITLPVLIMHGDSDRLVDPEGSHMLYERLGSRDKTLKLYGGFYHEVFNEPGRKQVFDDMKTWLGSHI